MSDADASEEDVASAVTISKEASPPPQLLPEELLELSPALALAYGGLSAKTLARDLERLAEAGLVDRGPAGYSARAEVARGLAVPHAAP